MSSQLNIVEVIENLTTLVDAASLDEIEVTPDDRLIAHKSKQEQRELYWVAAGSDDATLGAIRTTFSSVHSYLRHSFAKIEAGQDPKRFIEGIGTIMVLVGEAAKKLEKLGLVFKEKVSEISEYKDLQDFYQNTVVKDTFHRFARDLALREKKRKVEAKEEGIQEQSGVHLLNDLEMIKGDFLYELFYLKNEDGHHFYTPELARKIKLACDFGEFSKEYFAEDPFLQMKNWEDKQLQLLSAKIVQESKGKIRKFYKEAMLYKQQPFVILLNNALMALMLGSNSRNLLRQFSLKGSHRYFSDFQHFLRELLESRDYQKQLLYPAQETFYSNAVELTRELCYSLFIHGTENGEIKQGLALLTHLDTVQKKESLSTVLRNCFHHLQEAFQKHPSGPVFKALDLIREEQIPVFDPLMQSNLSEIEAHIKESDHEIALLRLACPTMQEIISKAYIVDEFKEYLRAAIYKQEGFHHLIVNFQDKTSWKEHARSEALEDLSRQGEFSDLLTVITLSKDSEFYYQIGPYDALSSAEEFIALFKDQLQEEGTGYYFSKALQKELFPTFIQKLFTELHKRFFHGQDILSKQDRLNFIELAYVFIELKVMELSQCSTLSLTSKDGLDISATASLALILLLRLSSAKKFEEKELEHIVYLLFGQTMLIRERVLHSARFERLLALVELLEKSGEYLKPFHALFNHKIEVAEPLN